MCVRWDEGGPEWWQEADTEPLPLPFIHGAQHDLREVKCLLGCIVQLLTRESYHFQHSEAVYED